MKDALIILGNGYDLHHGYATRYEDFIENVEGLENNIWYIHLKQKMLDSWVNVEEEFNLLINLLLELEANVPEYFLTVLVDIKYGPLLSLFGCSLKFPNEETHKSSIARMPNESLLKKKKNLNYDKCIELMIKDFEELKDALQTYIYDEVDIDNYKYKEDKLMEELSQYSSALILNFNYTETISEYIKGSQNIFIHGDVNSEIILGHNNVLDSRFAKFNKHSQQAIADKHVKNNIYDYIYHIKQTTSNFDLIVVGHSFATTDQPIIDWTITELYKRNKSRINELKVFHYVEAGGRKTDLYEKMHNIESFFTKCTIVYKQMDFSGSMLSLDGKKILDELHKYDKVKKIKL